jgi:hypothetical protein
VFVAAFPMVTTYADEVTKQVALKDKLTKLQSQYADLQKQLSSQASVTAQVDALKAEVDDTRMSYGSACDSIETSRDLIDLSWQYDVTIVEMTSSAMSMKIQGKDYPGMSYKLSMSGQVANFQNYLTAVGNKFASSQATNIVIQPALSEGVLDHADLTIMILCAQ